MRNGQFSNHFFDKPRKSAVRALSSCDLIVNASSYIADNGIKWRAMPHDLPAWQTVYGYFRRWSHSGVWQQVNQALAKQVRLAVGRWEQPSH
jgi:transposase